MRFIGLAILAILTLSPLLVAGPSFAEDESFLEEALGPLLDVEAEEPEEDWENVAQGWDRISDPWVLFSQLIGLTLATLLAFAIAYHPRMRAGRFDPNRWEGPKAILVYAIAGFFTAKIVVHNPAMAFVVFGIGQLLRFRSNIGSAKETGRAIIAVLVGLACGLDMFAIAIVCTGFFWSLMYLVEARSAVRLEVRKLPVEVVDEAVHVWRTALEGRGCRIQDVRTRGANGRFDFLVLFPTDADVETLVRSLDLPPGMEGSPQWRTD
jgi:hypothetical protein